MSDQIYPNCDGCDLCDYHIMKNECMDLKYGKGYKKDFYGQISNLRNSETDKAFTCSKCGMLHPKKENPQRKCAWPPEWQDRVAKKRILQRRCLHEQMAFNI